MRSSGLAVVILLLIVPISGALLVDAPVSGSDAPDSVAPDAPGRADAHSREGAAAAAAWPQTPDPVSLARSPASALPEGIDAAGGALTMDDLARLAAAQLALVRTGNAIVPDWPYDAIHMAWPAGDVDSDGADDVLWETYCVDQDGCADGGVPVVNVPLQELCYEKRHHIQVLAGSTGETLWQRNLDQAHPDFPYLHLAGGLGGCAVDTVVTMLPDGRSKDVLIYSWQGVLVTRSVIEIEHVLQRVNGTTGAVEWTWSTEGRYVSGPASVADTVFVVPFVQSSPDSGLPLLGDMQTNLLVRGIGFRSTGVGTPVASASAYHPDEWAAAVALDDGTETWRTPTFGPQADRNVYPITYHPRDPHVPPVTGDVSLINLIISYSVPFGCCFDLTGDQVPDLLYATLELPVTQPEQAPETMEGRGARMRLYDGADGSVAWELVIEDDSPDLCSFAAMPLGDVDGDGAHDFRLSVTYGEAGLGCPPGPIHTTSTIRSGPDHSVFWQHDTRDGEKSMTLAPLGDIDGDGGNDLLRMMVPNAEPGQAGLTEFQNITVGAVHGTTGDVLWEKESFAAALDLAIGTAMMIINGMPDFDGDGVGDVWLDRLDVLDDQTAVHHLSFVSGADGDVLTEGSTVGAFAIPLGTRDITGDGTDDYTVIQGDLDDIWITAYSGADGQPHWSRRVMSLNATNTYLALPMVKFHSLELAPEGAWDALLSLTFLTLDMGGGRGPLLAFTQQHLSLHGDQGSLLWGIPDVADGDDSLEQHEPTPAVQSYEKVVEEEKAQADKGKGPTTQDVPAWAVPAVFAITALAAGGGTLFLLGRRRG